MHILVSGSTGLVGRALCPALEQAGHTVACLLRRAPAPNGESILWQPEAGILGVDSLDAFDAVVHLAGEPIAAGRWTAARKKRIRDSRIVSTRLIAEHIANVEGSPPILISASALGYYGDRGDEWISEEASPGKGFLADVCREWEAATGPAEKAGARVAHLRTGLVLSAEGGALAKMLTPFRLGLGGPLGSGKMWMSWIHLNDLVGAIIHILHTPALCGPVNGFAPNPVTNKDFATTLGHVLGRPACLPAPAPVLRLALGEMADALLLSSLRGRPGRLLQSGFTFAYPELEPALAGLLTQPPPR